MFASSLIDILFWLVVGHAVADFAAQGTFFSQLKNRFSELNKAEVLGPKAWVFGLTYHAFIHGGFVAYATGYVWLGILEVIAHWVIDFLKLEGRFGKKWSFHIDQGLHLACKIVWGCIAVAL